MESRNLRGYKPPRHSSSYNYFAGHPRRQGGYMGMETGRIPHHHHHNHPMWHPGHFMRPHPPHYHPPHMHEDIRRDMEKQRIREEIILAEMARRRELEEEVRAELMMERRLAFRTGNPFQLSPVMGFDHSPMRLPLPGERSDGLGSLEERNDSSMEDRERGRGFESVPIQRGSADLKIAGGGNVEKKKIILLPKPDANMSGSKRKSEESSGGDSSELPPDFIPKKKVIAWSCEVCQVNVTSEIGLLEHYRGKKHKSKEAASHKSGKNYSIGLIQKKATETLQVVETAGPITQAGLTVTKAEADSPKNESDIAKEVQKISNPQDKSFKFWCELCGIRAPCRSTMNKHKRGKRHLKRLANQPVKVIVRVNNAKEVGDGGKEISGNVDAMSLDVENLGDQGHVDPASLDVENLGDQGHVDPAEPADDTEAQDLMAIDFTKPHNVQTSEVVLGDHTEELAGCKDATSENLIETLGVLKSENHMPKCQNEAEEELASGKNATSENLTKNPDALKPDYHIPENLEAEELSVGKDATSEDPVGMLDAHNSDCYMPESQTEGQEKLAGGEDTTSENLIGNLDALKSDYHVPEDQTEAQDNGTNLSKPERFRDTKSEDDGAATEPVDDSKNGVLLVNHKEEPAVRQKNINFESGTRAENGEALDISQLEAT